jgi:hypothetical protein
MKLLTSFKDLLFEAVSFDDLQKAIKNLEKKLITIKELIYSEVVYKSTEK